MGSFATRCVTPLNFQKTKASGSACYWHRNTAVPASGSVPEHARNNPVAQSSSANLLHPRDRCGLGRAFVTSGHCLASLTPQVKRVPDYLFPCQLLFCRNVFPLQCSGHVFTFQNIDLKSTQGAQSAPAGPPLLLSWT